MTSSNVYLDANGGVPLSSAGLAAIERSGKCANPSNTNAKAGREAEKEYLAAVEKIKKLVLGEEAEAWDLVNVSGASEGIVTCLTSLSDISFPILIAADAHPVVAATVARYRLKTTACPRSKEGVAAAMVKHSYSGLFITHAVSLTGDLSDVAGMSAVFRKYQPNSPIILDSTQVIGRRRFAETDAADAVVFSSHKFGGAKGHGVVLLRSKGPMLTAWKPLIPGTQQSGLRGGTLNVTGVAAAADALEEALDEVEKKREETSIATMSLVDEIKLRDLPRLKILAPLSTSSEKNLLNTVLLSLPFCSKAFSKALSENGYDVGTGSACQTKESTDPSERHPYQLRISLASGSKLDAKAFMDVFSKVYGETLERWKEKLEKEMDNLSSSSDEE